MNAEGGAQELARFMAPHCKTRFLESLPQLPGISTEVMYVCIHNKYINRCMYIHILYLSGHVCDYVHVCIYVYMHVCVRASLGVFDPTGSAFVMGFLIT